MTSPIAMTSPETVTRRRYAAQTWGSDGRPDRGASADTSITAVVAPASPRQMELLPDGMRSKEVLSVLSYTELRTVSQQSALPADEVIRSGVTYEVQRVDEWPAVGPLPRQWHALAVRRPELPPRGGP